MIRRLLVLIVALVLLGVVLLGQELYRPYRRYPESQRLVIEPGMRAPAVAALLSERGVLEHRLPFLIVYSLGRTRQRLKAGEYYFDRPLTPIEVYQKLTRGEVHLHGVVVPEGSDQFDIARIFSEELGIKPEDFLRAAQQSELISHLDPEAPSLEGYLFPDTYRFPRNVSANAAVAAMLARFHQVVQGSLGPDLRQSRRSLHDVITLASLVEKETGDPRERPLIAGVFLRRLEKKWPLDCDPTVVYAARLSQGAIDRPNTPITRSDLNLKSAYNTYRRAGLPPGPICNPGQASIRAVLTPLDDKFLYFVSNNRGGHVFARTLAEHHRNVARYRRELAALRRSATGGPNLSQQPPSKQSGGEHRGTKSSGDRAKQKQKTGHPGV